jgi:hypothetical protein
MMAAGADLLRQEYREVNAHLRANTTQFVNWFSFFLTFSLVAAAIRSVIHRQNRTGIGDPPVSPICLTISSTLQCAAMM